MSTLCVIPTYNEAETIGQLLGTVLATVPEVDVLVVDDSSPDGTGALVESVRADQPRVHLVVRPAKEGLGAAYRAGFGWGLAHGYDLLVEIDADLSHDPSELPALLAMARDGADLVIGSRYVPGGSTVGWSRFRRALSRSGNTYVRMLLGLPLNDATAGYRVFRREVLEALPVSALTSSGYCFQIETAYQAWLKGFRLAEVPITFRERVAGASKMSSRIVIEALTQVARWSVASRRGRGRRREQPPTALPTAEPAALPAAEPAAAPAARADR